MKTDPKAKALPQTSSGINRVIFFALSLIFLFFYMSGQISFAGKTKPTQTKAPGGKPLNIKDSPSFAPKKKTILKTGYCCREGKLLQGKMTESECNKREGTYFSSLSKAKTTCGFCCKNGRIFPVSDSKQKRQCAQGRRLFSNERDAKANCGWCCSNGKVFSITSEKECSRQGGHFFKKQVEANLKCKPSIGFCYRNGRIFPTSEQKCKKRKGTFFKNRTGAVRYQKKVAHPKRFKPSKKRAATADQKQPAVTGKVSAVKPDSPKTDKGSGRPRIKKKNKLADFILPYHINLPAGLSESTPLVMKYRGQVVGKGKVLAGKRLGQLTFYPSVLSGVTPVKKYGIDIFADGRKINSLPLAQRSKKIRAESATSSRHMADTFGDEAGPGARSRGFRIDCLRVNGTNGNQPVDSDIELSADFSNIPPSLRYNRRQLHITVSNREGGAILDRDWDPETLLRLPLNLSDITGSTPGEYEISGQLRIFYDPVIEDCSGRPDEPGYWTWWPTNNMNLYFRVEPPMRLPGRMEVAQPFEIPANIPSNGTFQLTSSRNHFNMDEHFTVSWEPLEGALSYRLTFSTHPLNTSGIPGVTLLSEDHGTSGPLSWSGTVGSIIRSFLEHPSHSSSSISMDDGYLTIYARVMGIKEERRRGPYLFPSNTEILHVADADAGSRPPAPILGFERRADSAVFFWSHETSGEGSFTIEKAYIMRDRLSSWSSYRTGIGGDQHMLLVPKEDLARGDFAIDNYVFRMRFIRPGAMSPETISPYSNIIHVSPFLPAPILMQLIPYPNPPRWSSCWAMHTVWLPNISTYSFEEQVSNDPGFSGTVSTGRRNYARRGDGALYEYADHSPFWTEVLEDSPRIYIRRRTFIIGASASSPWSNVLTLEVLP